jgi:hypothetical protein
MDSDIRIQSRSGDTRSVAGVSRCGRSCVAENLADPLACCGWEGLLLLSYVTLAGEYCLQVPWETNQSSSLSHYPRTKQSLRCSFIREAREEAKTEEGGWGGKGHGLIRDFAVDLGIWKEGRGRTWWAEIV